MMIQRTLYMMTVATAICFGTAEADDSKQQMLKAGEDWLKLYLEKGVDRLDIQIPERYKLDLPEGIHLGPKKFGYTWGDYDAWVSPFEPLDRLQWKQEFDGGHREFELNNDGFYFKFKKTF